MTQFLLDTSVIIDVLNDKRGRARLIQELLADGHAFSCCSINVAEVYAGMRPRERRHTENLLDSLFCYEITRSVAAQAGLLKHEWSERGITLSIADTCIAAAALANNLVLMTDNIKHYPMADVRKFEWPIT